MAFQNVTYQLVYSNPSASAAMGATLIDRLPPTSEAQYVAGSASGTGTFDAASNTLKWIVPLVPVGASVTETYALTLQLMVGGQDYVNNTAELDSSSGSVTAVASIRVMGPVDVVIGVYNEAGELIKVLKSFRSPTKIDDFTLSSTVFDSTGNPIKISYQGQDIGQWDGTNANGQTVANGEYYIKMDSTDAYGVTQTVTKPVAVQVSQETVNVTIYNSAGEVVRQFTPDQVRQLVAGQGAALAAVDYQVGQVRLSATTLMPSYADPSNSLGSVSLLFPSGGSMTWDGRNNDGVIVQNGTYYIELTSKKGSDTQQTVILAVNVLHGDLDASNRIVMAPNPVNLAQTGQAVFMIGNGGGPLDATTVKIYTVAGELIQTLYNEPGNPGRVLWNLRGGTSRVVTSGTYIAVVELRVGSGVTGRKILKVIVYR